VGGAWCAVGRAGCEFGVVLVRKPGENALEQDLPFLFLRFRYAFSRACRHFAMAGLVEMVLNGVVWWVVVGKGGERSGTVRRWGR
jgi:hypothetical protein